MMHVQKNIKITVLMYCIKVSTRRAATETQLAGQLLFEDNNKVVYHRRITLGALPDLYQQG